MFPKLIVLILVVAAIWIAFRWVNGMQRELLRRRSAAPRRAIEAEDLVACPICGAYLAADAPGCNRRDCPRLR